MDKRTASRGAGRSDHDLLEVRNPSTGEMVGTVPDLGAEEVGAAVESAAAAFPAWAARTDRERGILLFRAAALVREQHRDLARLLTTEQGKPLAEAVDEVRGFANILEFYAGISGRPAGEAVRLGKQGDCIVFREPLGVCGAVIPWNMPVLIAGWKTGPALLAGNTLVLKPASTAPLTVIRLAALMERAGIPPGVLTVVTGSGATAGAALVSHPALAKVSFTGSAGTGEEVRRLAARGRADLVLELGGSDPMLVMDDADIAKAVDGAVRGRFYNAGQTCTAVKRLYLHERIADEFIARLRERVAAIRVGDGLDPRTGMGPLNNREARDRIGAFVRRCIEQEDGVVLAGGAPPGGEGFARGFFYEPTIVDSPSPGSPLLSEETFGPVLPVVRVPDLAAGIREANRSRYGLGASVWTGNLGTAKAFSAGVKAGVVWVNRHLTVPPEIPFGGVDASGSGRENGAGAPDRYTRTKALFIGW